LGGGAAFHLVVGNAQLAGITLFIAIRDE